MEFDEWVVQVNMDINRLSSRFNLLTLNFNNLLSNIFKLLLKFLCLIYSLLLIFGAMGKSLVCFVIVNLFFSRSWRKGHTWNLKIWQTSLGFQMAPLLCHLGKKFLICDVPNDTFIPSCLSFWTGWGVTLRRLIVMSDQNIIVMFFYRWGGPGWVTGVLKSRPPFPRFLGCIILFQYENEFFRRLEVPSDLLITDGCQKRMFPVLKTYTGIHPK
jgi:hypothetical protein